MEEVLLYISFAIGYWYMYIQHRIVLFARFDWFLNLGISSDIHLLAASGGKNYSRAPFYQKIKHLFGSCYYTCVVYTKIIIRLGVGE